MNIAQALREAAERLADTSDTARLDAELLMAEALGVSRSDLLLRHMQDAAPDGFAALIERRLAKEPVAYILGRQEFYGLDFEVGPAVLIPRSDSETLIEAARAAFVDGPPRRILDLGTGSGALLVTALTLWPGAEGVGIDCSIGALVIAIRNAQRHANYWAHGVMGDWDPRSGSPPGAPVHRPDRGTARMVERDWTKRGWRKEIGTFDLILSNPPYVEDAADLAVSVRDHEPAGALFAGPEGLDDYRVLVPQLPKLLNPEGVALVEIGYTQAEAVSAIAASAGLSTKLHRDLANRPRALELRRSA